MFEIEELWCYDVVGMRPWVVLIRDIITGVVSRDDKMI